MGFYLLAKRNKIMTKQEVRWVKQHDWYMSSYCEDGEWSVYVREDLTESEPLDCFSDFESLKEWTGY